MQRFFTLLNKLSSLPALILAVCLFVSFIVYFLPMQKAGTEIYARNAGSVGLSFCPLPETVYQWAEAYGADGRSAFIKTWLTYDLFWPLAYTALFLIFINLSFRYVHGEKSARLCVLPLATLLLDYLENSFAIIIMSCYPERVEAAAWGLTISNGLKWITMGAASVLFAYGLAALPIRSICNRMRKA